MISGQSLTCPKGASLTFEIDMDTGSDLTGATAQWALCESWFDNAKVYLTKTGVGDGLFIGQDAGVWKITVNLAPTDTLDIPSGLLYHDCKVLLQSGDVEDVANGPFSLDPSVNIFLTNAPITRNLHAVQLLGRLGQTAPLTVAWLARNLLATQSLVGLGQSAAGTVTGGGVSPAFQADFTALTSLADWMSFSRASNAMVFDATGNLTYAPNNLVPDSNTFTAWSGNASHVTTGVADPFGGTNASTFTGVGANDNIFQPIGASGAPNYIIAMWVRRRTGTGGISFYTGAPWVSVTSQVTSSWNLVYVSSSEGNHGVRLTDSGDAVDIYLASIAAVTYETAPRSQDQVITGGSAYYGPRFDHAWNGSAWVATGLLIEEQRTNLVKDSGNLASVNWSVAAVTKSVSSTLGADNSNFMTLLSAAAGTGVAQVYNTTAVAITSGGNNALSVDFKKTNHNYVWLNLEDDVSGHWATIVIDLSTGTVTQTAIGGGSGTIVGTPTVTQLRDGIVRVEFICAISQATGYLSVGFANAATGNTFGSFGQANVTMAGTETVLCDAAQLSPGSTPTSYIPTTTAAVTRSEDIASLTGAALAALQASAFTLIAEIDGVPNVDGQIVTVGTSALLARPGGSTTNIKTQTTGSDLVASGGANSILTTFRAATAFDATGGSLVVNGGTVSTSSDTAITMSSARIGSRIDGFSIDSHFRSLAIYSSRLSDADLQTKSVVGASF